MIYDDSRRNDATRNDLTRSYGRNGFLARNRLVSRGVNFREGPPPLLCPADGTSQTESRTLGWQRCGSKEKCMLLLKYLRGMMVVAAPMMSYMA
jgi:hypothetical protein